MQFLQHVGMSASMRSRLLLTALLVAPVQAHHSAAMFDGTKSVTLSGVVTSWQFVNPHAWLHMKVPGAAGGESDWSVEFGSPNSLFRMGLRAKSLTPGDKVTVVVAPLRDGTAGGQIRSLTLPDGKVVQIQASTGGPGATAGATPVSP